MFDPNGTITSGPPDSLNDITTLLKSGQMFSLLAHWNTLAFPSFLDPHLSSYSFFTPAHYNILALLSGGSPQWAHVFCHSQDRGSLKHISTSVMSQTVSHRGARPAVTKMRPWVVHKWAAACPPRLNSCGGLVDYIFPISHPGFNGSERGFVQRSFNQSASNPVSGIGDDYLSFFSSPLRLIPSFVCSSDYVSPHRCLLFMSFLVS